MSKKIKTSTTNSKYTLLIALALFGVVSGLFVGGAIPLPPSLSLSDAQVECKDEGNGDAWGVNKKTNEGCWIGGKVDLSVCKSISSTQVRCPDGKRYDKNSAPSQEPTRVDTPQITNLSEGQRISTNQEIKLSQNNTTVTEWIVRVGSTKGSRDLYESKRLPANTKSHTIRNLPSNKKVYVSLNYKVAGKWSIAAYTFTTSADSQATSPVPSPPPSAPTTPTNSNPTDGNWSNTVSPPKLNNPKVITLSDQSSTTFINDFNKLKCDGKGYVIKIGSGQDAKIVMDKNSGPLKYPVWITGGKNVHIQGLDMDLAIQDGCDIGEATNTNFRDKNYNPRLPGSIGIRVEQTHTTFVEGVNIEMNGMEADCFVLRTPGAKDNDIKKVNGKYADWMRPIITAVRKEQPNRKFYAVNSRCTGYDGYDSDEEDTGIAEGIHGDVYQNQGADAPSVLVFENFTAIGTSNGITSHKWLGQELTEFKLRNYQYEHDSRYIRDSSPKTLGLIFTAHPKASGKFTFENVYINHSKASQNYGLLNKGTSREQRYGSYSQGSYIKKHSGMKSGAPSVDMAPESLTGRNYISPF